MSDNVIQFPTADEDEYTSEYVRGVIEVCSILSKRHRVPRRLIRMLLSWHQIRGAMGGADAAGDLGDNNRRAADALMANVMEAFATFVGPESEYVRLTTKVYPEVMATFAAMPLLKVPTAAGEKTYGAVVPAKEGATKLAAAVYRAQEDVSPVPNQSMEDFVSSLHSSNVVRMMDHTEATDPNQVN